MADRSVKVVLNAQVQGYVDGMNKASQATKQVSAEADKLSASGPNMQALGGILLGVGTAVSAIGIAAYKTGIEYNTMQQTTRAALTTLLGSAEAANAQMDKLDAFAKNSPFAKQVFIQAQQQMIGFGVAAEDVIPALDAIQNAVAAMGGSNDQISAISEIMARIKSESRLSGDALQRLGYYGIDAAKIIGDEMGLTAVEIREMASKPGGIPAERIWDPLVNGLQAKFGGAAANVKETFSGAVDRVKAAWRDFSSELARPLIDPNGGGALVDLLNWAADMMRGFQKLPEPVKVLTTNLVLLGGAVALVSGAAILAVPKVAEFRIALETLNISAGKTLSSLGPVAMAAVFAWLSTTLNNVVSELTGARVSAERLNETFTNTKDVVGDMTAVLGNGSALQGLGDDTNWAQENLQSLNTDLGMFVAEMRGSWFGEIVDFSTSFGLFGDESANTRKKIIELDSALAQMVTDGNTDEAAASFEAFSKMAMDAGWSQERLTKMFPEYTKSIEGGVIANQQHEEALADVSGAADDASGEIQKLDEIIRNFGSATLDAREAEREFNQAILDATAAAQENGATLDITTEAGIRNQEALDAMARAANDSAAANYTVNGSEEALRAQLDASREKLIEAAIRFGMSEEAARTYADQVLATPESVTTTAVFNDGVATQRAIAFRNLIRSIPGLAPSYTPSFVVGEANGGMFAYADGGIQSFAGGGFPSGIYSGGTPIHKFAEPETRWEAYISGKQGQEARNRQIWVEAGRRLGMGGGSSGPVQVSLAGATLRASIDGRPISLMIHDQVASALTAADTQNAVMV